jgi:hypothetical protein
LQAGGGKPAGAFRSALTLSGESPTMAALGFISNPDAHTIKNNLHVRIAADELEHFERSHRKAP